MSQLDNIEQTDDTAFKHSLFFEDGEDAIEAQVWVWEYLEYDDDYQTKDKDTGIFEYRFFTQKKLSDHDQRTLVRCFSACSYEFNSEDY